MEEIPKQIRQRPDCATWENAKEIVKAIPNPRNKAVAVLLAKTGCRLGEALEIKMDDLMLDDGFIRLRDPEDFIEQVQSVNEEVDGQIVLVLVSSQDSGAILDWTVLDYEDVMFEPYSEDELMTLLEQGFTAADTAVQAVQQSLLHRIAAETVEEAESDVRHAFNRLEDAVAAAAADGDSVVSEQYLDQMVPRLQGRRRF
ncbi:site-specific integrase [Natrinema halophilum]|uniref:site-specific integrase n=1 Tax=Natrinema halophilum TaxID=1699371 RepID=UPI001C5321EF|nr:site-specific integrase [Natrinema halophilum]UHQ95968.1 site-specific integrase [Natrinema halophilum]